MTALAILYLVAVFIAVIFGGMLGQREVGGVSMVAGWLLGIALSIVVLA